MYYIKLTTDENSEGNDVLQYVCRNCGNIDDTITKQNVCISSVDVKSKSSDCRYLINKYTKYDPTLPKTNKIKCPNTDCASKMHEELGHDDQKQAEQIHAGQTQTQDELGHDEHKHAEQDAEQGQAEQIHAGQTQTQDEQKHAEHKHAEQGQDDQKHAEHKQAEQGQAEHKHAEQGQAEQVQSAGAGDVDHEYTVLYIRYDEQSLKYIYLCTVCGTVWKSNDKV
jgi:hypothetical protein